LLALGAQGLFDGVAVTRGRVMVLVEGDRIVAVDRSGAAPPPYAEVVELTDATLLPGLVDAHVHLAFDPMGHPLVDVLGVDDEVLLSRMRSNAARALAAGITTMRDLGDARYLTGRLRSAWTGGPELLMSGRRSPAGVGTAGSLVARRTGWAVSARRWRSESLPGWTSSRSWRPVG
jgi:imidazolonepropionase-like amidohydrolase